MAEVFTYDYFKDEFRRFWDMCGDTRSTVDTLKRAFNGLAFVAANTLEETERVTHWFTVAGINYEKRLAFFLTKDVSAGR